MEYDYIKFEKLDRPKRKTSVWLIRNKKSDDILGEVSWSGPWRQYCFFSEGGCIFSRSCLEDIIDFINIQMHSRKEKKT